MYKIGGQFNECLLLWQPSGIFLYSTVIILICFMLCWKIKYDDDDDLVYCEKLYMVTVSKFTKFFVNITYVSYICDFLWVTEWRPSVADV